VRHRAVRDLKAVRVRPNLCHHGSRDPRREGMKLIAELLR
jgi:hypothetical protein